MTKVLLIIQSFSSYQFDLHLLLNLLIWTYIFQHCLLPLKCIKQYIFYCLVKFREYSFSASNALSSNPLVGSLPRIKISFFLLSICTEELIPTSSMITFYQTSRHLTMENIYVHQIQKHIQDIYIYEDQYFLPNFTAPNNVKLTPSILAHKFIS